MPLLLSTMRMITTYMFNHPAGVELKFGAEVLLDAIGDRAGGQVVEAPSVRQKISVKVLLELIIG
jgi:hypothetical protein